MSEPQHDDREFGRALVHLATETPDHHGVRRATGLAARSMRRAGGGAIVTGRWLAEEAIELAPHIPIRDLATLEEHYNGLSGPALAAALIRTASRSTAAVGAAAGALVGAEELTPPAWITIPVEVVVETLVIAAIEIKLIAELHEVYRQPVPRRGTERGMVLLQAWADRRGVTPDILRRHGGLGEVLGQTARHEIAVRVRRRMLRRTARNLSSLAPFFAGAVAGAEVNRRATRALGEAVVRDLAAR